MGGHSRPVVYAMLVALSLSALPAIAGASNSEKEQADTSLDDVFGWLEGEALTKIEVDVGSFRQPETVLSSPSTVSVINRATIDRYNFSSISEALRSLAGVDIYRTFFTRNIPTIRGILQDHFTNKVLISYIDYVFEVTCMK